MIGKILSLLLGLLPGGNDAASRAGGAVSGLAVIAALGGGVAWLFGPGQEWSVTLNALELSAVALGGGIALEYFRRLPPPGSG